MSAYQCNGVWAPKELSAFTAFVSGVIAIVATFGNMLIVFIVIKDPLKKLHTPFNYFIVHLAISDMIVGSINQPVAAYTLILEYMKQLDNTMTIIVHVTFFISVTASILSLMALSLDRFVAITYPLKYRKYLSWMRCFLISAAIWLFSLTLPMLYFKIGYINYLMIYTNTGIFAALITLVFTYVRISRFLRKQTDNMKKQLRTSSTRVKEFMLKRLIMDKKVTRVFLIVMVCFVATYLPAAIMVYILQYCPDCNCLFRHSLRDLSFLFIAINSCMNPIVYTLQLKHFRKSLRHLYRLFCRRRRHSNNDTFTVRNNRQIVPIRSDVNDPQSLNG